MGVKWETQVKLNYDQQNDGFISWPMRCWLDYEIGVENRYWFYDDSLKRIFFRGEEDKVKFILQWM